MAQSGLVRFTGGKGLLELGVSRSVWLFFAYRGMLFFLLYCFYDRLCFFISGFYD